MSEVVVVEKPFGNIESWTKDDLRTFISDLEKFALENGEAVDVPVVHHFSKSVYAREMKMPEGAMVIGKIHKHQNMNILSEGEVSVLSVDGLMKVKAPYTFVASPGAKRVIYAHTPVTWTTIHGTELTNVDEIEEQFIAKTYEEVVWVEGKDLEKLGGK